MESSIPTKGSAAHQGNILPMLLASCPAVAAAAGIAHRMTIKKESVIAKFEKIFIDFMMLQSSSVELYFGFAI